MLMIRFSRIGRKNYPSYRIIVSEKARDTFGTYLELLGNYNPRSKVCNVEKERVLHWISKGAQLSPSVHNLMVIQNIVSGPKIKIKHKKKQKEGEASKEAPKQEAPKA
ncbi:MAG: 30S ribosomal protein S16 [Parcubacteria group bacterium GW2011_GWA2_38_13]|nr:MAG: 30S ribosomal protein S16 [Parcubacteria group bacterium GW2011_GWA2_38_13]